MDNREVVAGVAADDARRVRVAAGQRDGARRSAAHDVAFVTTSPRSSKTIPDPSAFPH